MGQFTSTKQRPVVERFWEKVEKTDTCWNWIAGIDQGYGLLRVGPRMEKAHRLSLTLHGQKLLPNKEVDHLCRNRACVRPSHLEQVTKRENVLRGEGMGAKHARQTHCVNGHPLIEGNLKTNNTHPNWRACLTCHRISGWKARGKA